MTWLLAVVVALAALAGIFEPAIYARETATWAAQGVGQDWVNLVVVVPLLVAYSAAPRHRVVLGGSLLYTAYSFVIYAMAVHFNALFLVYCAGFGLATFALIRLLATARVTCDAGVPRRTTAATLFAIAGLFGLLWLGRDLPAIVGGFTPADVADAGLASNPVHVLDLALVLPAMIVAGVALLRRRPFAEVLAPVLLGFGVVMALAIAGMVATMYSRGIAADVSPVVAMLVVAAASGAVLAKLAQHLRETGAGPGHAA